MSVTKNYVPEHVKEGTTSMFYCSIRTCISFSPPKLTRVWKKNRIDYFILIPFPCFLSKNFLASFTSLFVIIFFYKALYGCQYHPSLHSRGLGKVSRFVMFNEVADRTIHVRSHKHLINALLKNAFK
jgi:hypothetical protein